MNNDAIIKANEVYYEGDMNELYNFIKPYLDKDDPYALYLYSRFSLIEWGESDEDYDKRYVDCLLKAANGNVPEAMYRLSSLYFNGDMVPLDVNEGRRYLNCALKLNYGLAKLSVGINLFYGSNGYAKDVAKAMQLISEASAEKVEGAADMLENIKSAMPSND